MVFTSSKMINWSFNQDIQLIMFRIWRLNRKIIFDNMKRKLPSWKLAKYEKLIESQDDWGCFQRIMKAQLSGVLLFPFEKIENWRLKNIFKFTLWNARWRKTDFFFWTGFLQIFAEKKEAITIGPSRQNQTVLNKIYWMPHWLHLNTRE